MTTKSTPTNAPGKVSGIPADVKSLGSPSFVVDAIRRYAQQSRFGAVRNPREDNR